MSNNSKSRLISLGQSFSSQFVAGGATLVMPNLKGLLLGSAIATLISDFEQRNLSEKEGERVGGLILMATIKINDNLSKKLPLVDYKNKNAEEILESIMLAAQREHQERKIIYYSNLLGNLGFHPEIDPSYANLLIRTASYLSYRQLVLIQLFSQPDLRAQLINENYKGKPKISFKLIGLLTEAKDLYDNGLLSNGGSVVLSITDMNPQNTETQGQGVSLKSLMELESLPQADILETMSLLSTPIKN